MASRRDNRILNTNCPINWAYPGNRGLVGCWLPTLQPGWQGGNTLRDLVGLSGKKGNNGTLTNGPTWTADTVSGFGAVSCDGSGPYLSITLPFSGAIPGVQYSLPFALSWTVCRIGFPSAFSALIDSDNGQFKTEYNTGGVYQSGINFGSLTPGNDYFFTLAYNPGASNTPGTYTTYVNGLPVTVASSALSFYWLSTLAVPFGYKLGSSFSGVSGLYGAIRYHVSSAVGTPAIDDAKASSIYDQWRRGFSDVLSWLSNRVSVYFPAAAGGFLAAWATRRARVVGGGVI